MQDLQDQEESVRIAVRALGDMRNATTPPDFASRMSQMPLVSSVLSVYETGKNSSRVMKYGARMMESSLQTISKPVIDRLPVDVNQLDEFACRQLDRIERYRRPSELEKMENMQLEEGDDGSRDESAVAEDEDEGEGRRSSSRKGKERQTETNNTDPPKDDEDENSQQVAQRSRWQAMLLEAGGISAALSEESMRRLKYCLQWLQYATAHIDAQILVLRDFTASLQQSTSNPSALISPAHMRQLHHVRKDVVQTIRQVVDVVSRYAGGALPEPARNRVRGFILHLPQRWASAANSSSKEGGKVGGGVSGVGVGVGRRSRYQHHRERGRTSSISSSASASQPVTPSSSSPTSPISSPRLVPRRELPGHGHGHHSGAEVGMGATAGAATQAAQRILTLSTESLDMMRGVMGVVKESLDRADAWVERLRVVGLQRTQQQQQEEEEEAENLQSQLTSSSSTSSFMSLNSDMNLHFDYRPGRWSSSSSLSFGPPRTPGTSCELGGLDIAGGGEGEGEGGLETPKIGLKSLPEEDMGVGVNVKNEKEV